MLRPRAGITTFGFGTNPNTTTVTFTDNPDGAFAFAEVQTGQQNFPGGFKDIDVCVYTQGCSGGSQGTALAAGAFDDFNLVVNFDPSSSSVAFEPFPIKFQTTQGSFEFGGGAAPTDYTDGASPTDVDGAFANRHSSGTFGTRAFGGSLDWHEPICQKINLDDLRNELFKRRRE